MTVAADIDQNQEPDVSVEFRRVVSDAFVFVRSVEINKSIATITIEDLMADQIARNGESNRSNAAQYNPYGYDPKKVTPASTTPSLPVNFAGGSDTSRPTKIQQIEAIKNSLSIAIEQIKKTPAAETIDPEQYVEAEEHKL